MEGGSLGLWGNRAGVGRMLPHGSSRTAVTLQAKIREYILPGSHIVSDGWAAYGQIDQMGGGIYTHDIVIHERNFVDPTDGEVHTQNVENMWMRAKRKIRRQFGTSTTLFPYYIHEFAAP